MCGWLKADLRRHEYPAPPDAPPGVHPDNIREVIRLSELYLDGTIRFAIAADARALSLAGMLAGATTALAAGGITLLFTQGFSLITAALAAAAFTGSAGWIVGLWYAVGAVSTIEFNVAGNFLAPIDSPDEGWNSTNDLSDPLSVAQLGQARIYQEQIGENRQSLILATGKIDTAAQLLKWMPLVAIGVAVAVYLAGRALALCAA